MEEKKMIECPDCSKQLYSCPVDMRPLNAPAVYYCFTCQKEFIEENGKIKEVEK